MTKTDALSESIDWKLVEMLYGQRGYVMAGTLALGAIALLGYSRTGQTWFCWWMASTVVLAGGRLWTSVAFARRRTGLGRPRIWRRRFAIGLWANGFSCGVGGALAVLWTDAFTQLFVLMMLTTFVMGSASRNSSDPQATIGSVLLAEVPVILGCIASRELYHMLFTPLIVLFTFSAVGMTRSLYEQSVRFLVTDEERADLVGHVTRINDELAVAIAKLAELAGTDALTGVPNRRSFDIAFETETRSAQRDASQFSIMMFDIDLFKAYNDHYGHPAGDVCLCLVAHDLAAGLRRPRHLLARYGGEEFVAILPHTDLAQALQMAEDRRASIEALAIAHASSASGIVTISVGVATFSADETTGAADFLRRADEALYVAKRNGRNRVYGIPAERNPPAPAITVA